MTLWEAITWDVARAGGFTAYILAALSVAVGLALSMKWQSPGRWPRLVNNELHNFLALLALIFTSVHVLAVWIDPYTKFGLNEILVPLASHYRPIWMALGIVSLYLGIAIGISTWLRPIIGYAWWRRLHFLTLALYVLVTIHGIATGSDTTTLWGLAIYAISIVVIVALFSRRVLISLNERRAKRMKAQTRPTRPVNNAQARPGQQQNNAQIRSAQQVTNARPEWRRQA